MADKPTDKPELSQESASRRNLLKKAVYTAPVLITLGLVVPKEGAAAVSGEPPGGPKSAPSQSPQRRKPGTN
jgi:hypothetical protein